MKRRLVALAAAGVVGLTASCQDFLDVNTNPNAPETVAANLYLSPMLHWVATAPLWDGRFTTEYTQMLSGDDVSVFDLHGPITGVSDNGGQVWRDVYWTLGQNLIDMMEIAQAEKRWDILGVGYTLKAWGWYALTSQHGEIIISEAFDQTKFSFGYDSQEFAYEEIQRNLDSAIVYLSRTDDAVDAGYLAVGDKMYNGDRTKWLKFAHGLYAITLSHYSNKASYDPAAIIQHVDASLASAADDALWGFGNTEGEDRNFLGRARGNYTNYRTTQFAVGLLNGTALGMPADPRMPRMIAPTPSGTFVGVDVLVDNSYSALPDAVEPNNPHGYPQTGGTGLPQLYIFSDLAKVPVMTYAQLQFVKAEAAFRAGNKALARTAYIAGINGHFDFVNNRNRESGLATQISTTERNAFLANAAVVPTDPNALTLTQIMTQKYIAQWGWAFIEAWMDMRRYHYTDLDPMTGQPVYPGYQMPPTFYSLNNGKPVYRLRPRYNSEYVWNQAGLDEIGGLAQDYHTKPLWIITP